MIKYAKQFQSYEGEGPKIGLKTLFLTYDKNKGEEFDWNSFYQTPNRPQSVYVNFEEHNAELFDEFEELLNRFESHTFEVSFSNYLRMKDANLPFFGSWFIRIEEKTIGEINCNEILKLVKSHLHISFKIEANTLNFRSKVEIANFIAGLGKNISVYIMPLFKENAGEYMMDAFEDLNNSVRIMPPTQFLINLK